MLTISLLIAVFLGALVSGWHCALMCGGIATIMERPISRIIPLKTKSQIFYQQLILHLGRVSTYGLLGALAAWIGLMAWQQNILPIQRWLFVATSLLLIWMGLRILNPRPSNNRINHRIMNRIMNPIVNPIIKLVKGTAAQIAKAWATHLGARVLRSSQWFSGMLWGLVPCGLVYSVLPLAFLSGDILTGAALMLAFGLGTLPNLMLISKFSATLTQFGQYRMVRYLAAGLLFMGAFLGLYRAWGLPMELLKGGFCLA